MNRPVQHRSPRLGGVLVQVTIALLALLAVTAFAADVTRLHIAAQRAQAVADAACFGGGARLPDPNLSRDVALKLAAGNNGELPKWPAAVNDADVTFYPGGSSIYAPDDGRLLIELGPEMTGLMVQARVSVDFSLARAVGLTTGTVMRFAVVIRGAVMGLPCVPIWISAGSPELESAGSIVNLVKTDTAYDENGDGVPDTVPPGSFGFIDMSISGNDDWFASLLRGYNVTPAVREASFLELGQTITAYTGEHVGQWNQALRQETGTLAGTARLERVLNDPTWSAETYEDHSKDNPRIMLVPIVNYTGQTGANCTYEVVGFAEMWLLDVTTIQGDKVIQVQFIDWHYSSGGGGELDPRAGGSGGVFIVRAIA
jgi:hypothetical protein